MRRRDAQDLGHLLGDPDAFGVAVERVGRPQRGALLLVAAVAVEREGRADQLADGDQRAAMFELGPRIDEEQPGSRRDVSPTGIRSSSAGWRAAAAASRSLQPCASITSEAGRAPATRATALRQPAAVSTAMRFARQDVRMSAEFEERDGGVEVWRRRL